MSRDPFDESLVFEGEVPLNWADMDALPSETALAALNAANEAMLRSCEALEETHRLGRDDTSEWAQEFTRIDSKLNLVLELLGDLLIRHGDLPPHRSVRFNASAVEWLGPDGPDEGQLVKVSLYICSRLPKALELFGEVHSQQGKGERQRTVIGLLALSQNVADGLERLVFRRHRREVAQIRGRDRQD